MNPEQPPVTPGPKPQTPEAVVGHALLVLRAFPSDGVEQAREDAALIVGALRTCGMLTGDRTALDRAEDKATQWREAYEALRTGIDQAAGKTDRRSPGRAPPQ